MTPASLPPGTDIGHVHLKVADLERAVAFYRDVLGFTETQRLGAHAAFLSAGGYHHHIGLNTWESAGGKPPGPGTTGLYHLAVRLPTRAALADSLKRLDAAGVRLEGAADHGVSEALYLRDPDGNGVELYWDLPRADWPRAADGRLAMFTRPLDLAALRSAPAVPGPIDLAHAYLEAVFANDFDALAEVLATECRFRGPLASFDTAVAYVEALRDDPMEEATYHVVHTFASECTACVVYQFRKPGVQTTMMQTFETRVGRIRKMELVFDPTALE